MLTRTRRASVWSWPRTQILFIITLSSVTGPLAYVASFLVAYGFRDRVGAAEHGTFLIEIATYAVLTGLVSAVLTSGTRSSASQRTRFGLAAAGSLNALAVGIGSVVSSLNKDQGSVSADFSRPTDVAVAATLFLSAATLAVAARRSTLA